MSRTLPVLAVLLLCGCAGSRPVAPKPLPPKPPPAAEPRVQVVRDPELERQVANLELRLMERDAVIESLNGRLEEALQEVVGTMGKLRSLASRAEAASAMAEADVAIQSIAGSGRDSPESKQAIRLMQQSAAEFKQKNFGGALYLANQAKSSVRAYQLAAGGLAGVRPGEMPFAVPVKLRTSARSNVREGPGLTFAVSFTADANSPLSGVSYLGDWIRIANDAGKEGWILRSLVVRRRDGAR